MRSNLIYYGVLGVILLLIVSLITSIIISKTKSFLRFSLCSLLFSSLSGGGIMAWQAEWLPNSLTSILNQVENSTSQPSKNSSVKSKQDKTRNHLRLGNPSNAKSSDKNNYLLVNSEFALSYNSAQGIPNWVAWEVTKNDLGDVDRQNDFRPDNRISSFNQVLPTDYIRSGFDRGHLCPSADRTSSKISNSATFLMTNMSPQTNDLNAGPWEKLERFTRSLVRRNERVLVYAGSFGSLGALKGKNTDITIPAFFWKVIVVLNQTSTPFKEIPSDSRVIAVIMPNQHGIKESNWRTYKTSISAIEDKTKLSFFDGLKYPSNFKNQVDRSDN